MPKMDLKVHLTTVLERGPFNYPITLFRRLGVCLRGFQGIAEACFRRWDAGAWYCECGAFRQLWQ